MTIKTTFREAEYIRSKLEQFTNKRRSQGLSHGWMLNHRIKINSALDGETTGACLHHMLTAVNGNYDWAMRSDRDWAKASKWTKDNIRRIETPPGAYSAGLQKGQLNIVVGNSLDSRIEVDVSLN